MVSLLKSIAQLYHHYMRSSSIGVGIVLLVNCLLDLYLNLSKCIGMLVIDSLVVIVVNVKLAQLLTLICCEV